MSKLFFRGNWILNKGAKYLSIMVDKIESFVVTMNLKLIITSYIFMFMVTLPIFSDLVWIYIIFTQARVNT